MHIIRYQEQLTRLHERKLQEQIAALQAENAELNEQIELLLEDEAKSNTKNYELENNIKRLREALDKCMEWFASYPFNNAQFERQTANECYELCNNVLKAGDE